MRLDFLLSTMAGIAVVLSTSICANAADAKLGEVTFHQCGACHSLVEGQTKVGPSLFHVFDRKAGSLDDYSYSAAMKNSGLTWDEPTLLKYLQSPRAVVPGTKMSFPGIKDTAKIEDLIAYLKSVHG